MPHHTKALGAILIMTFTTCAIAAGDAVRGKARYDSLCTACHNPDYNGVGPAHRGVFGRKAASRADYAYSPALTASQIVWHEKTLDRWLANPEKFVPGQKMGISAPSAKDRSDIIAYLKTLTAN
ncbi:MAG: c-type cytochrome [Betaproteobacteria bacterium]|nr:c-type cytochrome [Betaproteobacteria bacterium]